MWIPLKIVQSVWYPITAKQHHTGQIRAVHVCAEAFCMVHSVYLMHAADFDCCPVMLLHRHVAALIDACTAQVAVWLVWKSRADKQELALPLTVFGASLALGNWWNGEPCFAAYFQVYACFQVTLKHRQKPLHAAYCNFNDECSNHNRELLQLCSWVVTR